MSWRKSKQIFHTHVVEKIKTNISYTCRGENQNKYFINMSWRKSKQIFHTHVVEKIKTNISYTCGENQNK
jgi:hypothetical protein